MRLKLVSFDYINTLWPIHCTVSYEKEAGNKNETIFWMYMMSRQDLKPQLEVGTATYKYASRPSNLYDIVDYT